MSKMRVLLVDDEVAFTASLEKVLIPSCDHMGTIGSGCFKKESHLR